MGGGRRYIVFLKQPTTTLSRRECERNKVNNSVQVGVNCAKYGPKQTPKEDSVGEKLF